MKIPQIWVLIILAATISCDEIYNIEAAENVISAHEWKPLGKLVHGIKVGKSSFDVTGTKAKLYDSLLKKTKNPILFRFTSEDGETVFKSVAKFDKDTNSFGFVVHTDDDNEISAINAVKSGKNNSLFAKTKQGRISFSRKTRNYDQNNFDDEDEEEFLNNLDENEDEDEEDMENRKQRKNRSRKRKRKKKRKQEEGFLKKYFWWLVIGGLIVYKMMSFDPSKFEEMKKKAQEQAAARNQPGTN